MQDGSIVTPKRAFDRPGRSALYSREGMACTSHPLATQVAIDVLKGGGSAMDAAIAACAMQCVVEPGSTGIGGDCFAMYAPDGTGTPLAFNGSGRAPAGATSQALAGLGVTSLERGSPHSVIIPGAVDAWTRLHADHGRIPFAEVLAPAIDAARHGYPLSPRVQSDIAGQAEYLREFPKAAALYLVDGQAPPVASIRTLKPLADALDIIAREGRDGFYRGTLAEDMVGELQSLGGLHTLDDFAAAAGSYVEPISVEFRGRRIWECPPNGQGVIALLLLNIMDESTVGASGPLSVDRIHTEIEACRLAYRARGLYLCDPDHSEVPLAALLSRDYATAARESIDPARATVPPVDVALTGHRDTVYLSVVDKDRNVCSFINTLYWPFGSGITTTSGITLTNRGQGFVIDSTSPNCIAPGKRPLHTIIPAMASRGDRVELCFGVMGGDYQAMGHQQFLSRYYDYGCDIQQAMDLPRYMVDPSTGEVELESGIGAELREALMARGHVLSAPGNPIGGSQAISIDWENRVLAGGSDPRKDGCSIGY